MRLLSLFLFLRQLKLSFPSLFFFHCVSSFRFLTFSLFSWRARYNSSHLIHLQLWSFSFYFHFRGFWKSQVTNRLIVFNKRTSVRNNLRPLCTYTFLNNHTSSTKIFSEVSGNPNKSCKGHPLMSFTSLRKNCGFWFL